MTGVDGREYARLVRANQSGGHKLVAKEALLDKALYQAVSNPRNTD